MEIFIDNYILGDSLYLKNGYIKTEVFSLSEHLAERGEKIKEEKWLLLEEALDFRACRIPTTASVVDMKIRGDASSADLFELRFEAINGKTVWKLTVSVNESGEIVLYDPTCLPTPVNTGVLISDSEFASLRFEHYWYAGDGTVSAEIDGSNRYLFLENVNGQSSLIIRPFGEREGAKTLEFEFDVEYLYKEEINKNLHTFVLVSEDGTETPLFNLLNMHTGAGWAVRATTAKGSYISGGPNVISRQQLISGKLSGNGGDMSKTVVKIILDLESGVVTATFRGTRPDDTFTVTAVTDAVALKVVSGECKSGLTLDNVRAEYVHPIPEYNLGFVVDGEEYYNVFTEHNALITLPAAPEKDGYIFEGWYFDNGVWSEPLYSDVIEDAWTEGVPVKR